MAEATVRSFPVKLSGGPESNALGLLASGIALTGLPIWLKQLLCIDKTVLFSKRRTATQVCTAGPECAADDR